MDKDYKYEPGARQAIAEDKSNSSARLPILVEREKEYGDFGDIAITACGFKDLMHKGLTKSHPNETFDRKKAIICEALGMIATKLARLCFNPYHKDSWKDIIGYCTLVLEELEF